MFTNNPTFLELNLISYRFLKYKLTSNTRQMKKIISKGVEVFVSDSLNNERKNTIRKAKTIELTPKQQVRVDKAIKERQRIKEIRSAFPKYKQANYYINKGYSCKEALAEYSKNRLKSKFK